MTNAIYLLQSQKDEDDSTMSMDIGSSIREVKAKNRKFDKFETWRSSSQEAFV